MLTFFFFQAEDGIRARTVTGVQTCALPIYPIEHTAVARDEVARVLRPDAPLDRGFGEISDLPDHAEERPGTGRAHDATRGNEPHAQTQPGRDRNHELRDRALDGLARAQHRRDSLAADRRPDQVSRGLAGPRDADEEQDEERSIGTALQPDGV